MAPGKLPITDARGLRQALTDANLPTLLMVYVQYTQDEAYLERFAPCIRSMFSIEPTSVPEELAADLRERLFELLTRADPPQERALSREFVRRMMSVSVGEEVAAEQVPVLYDQMAFEKPVPRRELPGRKQPPAGFRVAVIGAGMGGIAAGVKLDEAGYDFTIIEKNADFGGTWLENVYPGVAVDTPSHFYSFSFEQHPDWSSYYPKGAEIERYLLGVAKKYGLRDKVLFNTRVLGCAWDEAKQLWRVTTASAGQEQVLEFNAVINAHGVLNRWSMPDIPGLGNFKGPAMHSAGWDPGVDLRGKRVALIGTGASGAQLATATAPLAAQLTVFQRSRHWVMPNHYVEVPETVRWAQRHIPHYAEWFRFRAYWFAADGLYANIQIDPEWPHQETSISAYNDGVRQYVLQNYHAKLANRPDLQQKLIPSYPVFAKRICMDINWLDTLKRDNVTLEDNTLDHIVEDGIVLKDGRKVPVDVIICATGFDVSDMTGGLKIIGRGGRNLREEWGEDDPRAYLGVTVPGYPNFFLSVGPNSAPNHAGGQNIVSETQVHYALECLELLNERHARALEPTQEATDAFNAAVDEKLAGLIWSRPDAKSYYKNKAGRIIMSSPYRLVEYWLMTRNPEPGDYRIE